MDHHVARPRRTFVGLAAMAAGAVALVVGAFPGAANATDGPETYGGNHGGGGHGGGGHGGGGGGSDHPCPDEDFWYWHWGPQNQNEVPGVHTEDDRNIDRSSRGGDITFTISPLRVEGQHMAFDFESSVPITAIYAKGYSDDGHTITFEQPVTSGSARTADRANNQYVKHVIICPAPEQPTTTTTAPTTSTTAPPTTSTTAPTTSTTEVTTTTTAPTTSSTVAPTTSSTMATTTTVSSGGGLPVTGSNTGLLLGIGGLLLLAGGGFLIARRRLGGESA